ncbi:hypothetical protein Hanom_Chr06g00504811 [Helianthus anomalus]
MEIDRITSVLRVFIFINFFEQQFWITDGPLEYHRATSGTTRSYPSPLGYNACTLIQEENQ